MSASFRRIDYSLRPAKHAERRMLCDVFRRLRPFGRVEDYVYAGFGSVWFSDFALFHRALGIKHMVSIEQEASAKERIEANTPFRIPIDFRPSRDALPELDWTRHLFLWLDYDDPLSPDMLLDMRTVARRARSGTTLAVSVQCVQAPQVSEANQDSARDAPSALSRFIDAFGRDRIPQATSGEQLYGWAYGTLSRTMVLQEIEAELARRNSSGKDDDILFQPVCEIEYEDGAKMTTLIGVFFRQSHSARFEACHFDGLEFRTAGRPVRIAVPKLTVREFKALERQLPLAPGEELELGPIPPGEAGRFASMYRYLPNFAVLEG